MARSYYAGIDIGGTKIYVVITDSKGAIIASARKKSKAERGFATVMERVHSCVSEACDMIGIATADITVAGVGAPSPILPNGVAVSAANMGWRKVPLVGKLSSLLGCPVYAENDCNAGTYGEYCLGPGKDAKLLVGLFMGTGLGGGIVVDGKLTSGVNFMGAELGHMTISRGGRICGCGKKGCLEAYASKTGMGYKFKEEILCNKRESILVELTGGVYDNVKSSILKKAWLAKDEVTVETLTEAAEYLGDGVGSIITMLAPDMVVIGGGVFEALGRQLLPIVRRTAKEATYPVASFRDTKICLASLGDNAVALGALEYAKSRFAANGAVG